MSCNANTQISTYGFPASSRSIGSVTHVRSAAAQQQRPVGASTTIINKKRTLPAGSLRHLIGYPALGISAGLIRVVRLGPAAVPASARRLVFPTCHR